MSKNNISEKLNLSILELLRKGKNPAKICKILNIRKSALQHRLTKFKASGQIRKVGYGVWEVQHYNIEEVQQSTEVTNKQVQLLKPDTIRAHAFVFHFELPKNLKNWDKRAELLSRKGIRYESLNILGGGQKILFKGRKVWLTEKSIIVYEKDSFFAAEASKAQSKALSRFRGLLEALEAYLGANFNIGKSRFRISRQHYALIKNALARQYNEKGEKLRCFYPGEGQWFVIDDSYNLAEAETQGNRTPLPDSRKVQDFFNGIKKLEGFTPEFVTDSMARISENQQVFAENMRSHISAIQKLGKEVEGLAKAIKEFKATSK